jgi:hypothetical protein
MSAGLTILSKLKIRYRLIRVVEVSLFALFVVFISFGSLQVLRTGFVTQVIVSMVTGITAFVIRFVQLGLHTVSEETIAAFLNAQYPESGASADLVLAAEDQLSPLAKLQQSITLKNLESLTAKLKFPNRIKLFALLTVAGLAACVIIQLSGLTFTPTSLGESTADPAAQHPPAVKNLPSEIKEATIVVSPPAYTRIAKYKVSDLTLNVQENSKVTWSLRFSRSVETVNLVTSSQDTTGFSFKDDRWELAATPERNDFYQIVWKDEVTHASDYYKIEIVKDQPPTIKLNNLNQFTQVAYDSRQSIEANPVIADDYGLTDAYIIATVSKGSGESVKFREEKIRLSVPGKITGKQVSAKHVLDLKKMGMEPGDELYFYVEAFDNKTPLANRSRTETYFISIPDTVQTIMTADAGLGVDLMPEYFRSQRQIIIDTEKLIRERKTISKKEFNSRSNELGYDQKVLRLRYGQFLGEEAESGIGPVETHAEEEHDEPEKPEDMIKAFGHQHDTENEHNLVEEKDPTKKDVDGGKKDDLLAGFVHEHDNEESATFFFQSLKMKLKAALAQMWDAELYLRLNEPGKSLPYQYTALKLLKEISNDSRIYVHRTGFEPPPVKEEKRLSADLSEIFNTTRNYEAEVKEHFPGISEAIRITENLLARQASTLTQPEKKSLIRSGRELAQAALENPALLPGLSALKEITTQDGTLNRETLKTLRRSYWLALPKQPARAGKGNSALHDLDHKLIQQLAVPEQ